MSTIKVTSNIEKILDGSFGNSASVKNLFKSKSDGNVDEFVSDYCLTNTWIFNATQAAAFSEDLLTVLDSNALSSQVTFIHVQCYKKVKTPENKPDPVRFEVELDGKSLGKLSQFQLANIEGFIPASVQITAPEISGTDECIMSVVVGFNKP